jgi:hypothetical protein
MKKLILIVATLMIAGGISAHGYCLYHGGYGYRDRVIVRPYGYYAPRPVVINAAPIYYGGGYGYRHDCDRGYHGYYRSGRCR